MTRLVAWFSCGAASAVATKLSIPFAQSMGYELVIARCIVKEEHPDNERFSGDCEAWFSHPITNLMNETHGGSVFNVMKKRQYAAGIEGAPCTLLLKKQVREEFQRPDDVNVFGYCADEQGRWDAFLDANNIKAHAPMIERGITHDETLAMVKNAGIELPEMYRLGYQHNNCIGCVKASGAGYWNMIRRDFPERFWMMAGATRMIGARLTRVDNKRVFLDELPDGYGDYTQEPEHQCGIFCEMAERDIKNEVA